ncbi:MAG: peptidoglycan DD-metalloendopeptidase family protein [Patescibacteria group bacterium]
MAPKKQPEVVEEPVKLTRKRSLKRLGFNTGGYFGKYKKLISKKHFGRSLNAFTGHWGIAVLALIVIISGVTPEQTFSSPSSPARSRTVIELASANYFHESALYDEVIVTVGENSDFIFKTGATETIITRNNRTTTIVYDVRAGESVASVARDFGISPDTLKYANKLSSNNLTVGQQLKIPPIDGIYVSVARNDTLSSISRKYKVDVDEISRFNNLDTSQPIFAGQEILIPGVVAPKAPTANQTSTGSSATITPSGVASSIIADGQGQFIWPLQSATHFISQGYKSYHQALDLNRLNGWGIYASASGVATVIPGRYGYGNHIDINHGGGWVTRYAHLSEFKIKNGEYVQQGQLIGIMGSTGRSTGPHLHFEIRFNDKPLNPLNYLPK